MAISLFVAGWVGERPARGEAATGVCGGLCGSENAGMSNESAVGIRSAD